VLLLDEPLGALDAKLRKALQLELTGLQREVGITFVYVTHDQEEALTMSDRLAVMDHGRVAQCGTPRHVYEEPADAYVADFLGVANLLPCRVVGPGRVEVAGCELDVATPAEGDGLVDPPAAEVAREARIVVRPERVRLCAPGEAGANRMPATVEQLVYVGPVSQVRLRLGDGTILQALVANDGAAPPPVDGEPVGVHVAPDALRVVAG
jgi:ABC-type Fe3+/spermidine/putrescine transport system ATPase subunit